MKTTRVVDASCVDEILYTYIYIFVLYMYDVYCASSAPSYSYSIFALSIYSAILVLCVPGSLQTAADFLF